jgi:hypothetical protein
MSRQISHRYLPHGHYTEAPGPNRDAAIAAAAATLPPDYGLEATRVRRLGPGWWGIRYTCPRCPSRRAAPKGDTA